MPNFERNDPATDQRQPLVGDDQEGRQIGLLAGDEDLAFPENAFGLELTPGAAAGAAYDGQIV